MFEHIRRIYKPLVGVATLTNTMGTVVIFIMVALMNADVIARGVFTAPIRGVIEVTIFSLILIVFLQLPDVVRSNRLTRSDGFLSFAKSRFPRFGDGLSRVIDFAAFIFMALIAWTTWPEFFDSLESCSYFVSPEFGLPNTGDFWVDLQTATGRCEYFGTPGIFTAPWWPAKLTIAFSVTLCSVIFFFKTILGEADGQTQNQPQRGSGS